jgi:rare lipoprotein A
MKKLVLVMVIALSILGCEQCATQVEEQVAELVVDETVQWSDTTTESEVASEPESEPTLDVIPSTLPPEVEQECEEGYASWYGPGYYGNRTANGERYWGDKMTAAHRTLPFGTIVDVCRIDGRAGPDVGECIEVRINDRGPYIRGRIIDLSRAAAEEFNMIGEGTALVRICIVEKPE